MRLGRPRIHRSSMCWLSIYLEPGGVHLWTVLANENADVQRAFRLDDIES
jgi:hypothetical protein